MSQVKFIQHNGQEVLTSSESGESLMSLALENAINGIDGDCGGSCICATCHVYVDAKWIDKVGPADADEEALLALNPDRRNNSRLCYQITASDHLGG